MAKVDYVALAPRIIELVGGTENVSHLTHCVTRLRFTVRDKSKVDEEGITATEGLKGVVWAGDQLQIVIGTSVGTAYDAVVEVSGFDQEAPVDENLDAEAPKGKRGIKDIFTGLMGNLVACIVPGIPAFMAMGLFAALVSMLGPGGLGVISEGDGLYQLLSWAQLAIQNFMPIVFAYTAATKFKASPITAIVMTIICLSPDLMAAISAGEFNLAGIAPIGMTLSGQMVPAILGVWVLSKVEKLIKKILPDSLKYVFEGFLALVIMVPLMIYAITPLGILIGSIISLPIQAVANFSLPLAACLASALWVPMISVGLHAALGAAFMMDFYTTGVNYTLMPATMSLGYIALAVLVAIMLRAKGNKALREDAKDGAVAAFVGGVVEPSIYTIFVNYPKTMIAICAGMGACGLTHVLMGAGAYAASASSFLGITSFLAGGVDNLMRAIPGIAIGMVVGFALVMILGVDSKPKDSK